MPQISFAMDLKVNVCHMVHAKENVVLTVNKIFSSESIILVLY